MSVKRDLSGKCQGNPSSRLGSHPAIDVFRFRDKHGQILIVYFSSERILRFSYDDSETLMGFLLICLGSQMESKESQRQIPPIISIVRGRNKLITWFLVLLELGFGGILMAYRGQGADPPRIFRKYRFLQ